MASLLFRQFATVILVGFVFVSPAFAQAGIESQFKSTLTTYFFVGERSDASDHFIANKASYWDDQWQQHYGGVDAPDCRDGYGPCDFKPKENPFYFALPYGEFDAKGNVKRSVAKVPWYRGEDPSAPLSVLKNHWIEVTYGDATCFGQWEDVGPVGEDDFAYVFGSAIEPANKFGAKAGLDVSPALWKCLGLTDNDVTSWRFVDASAVPPGPWKAIVTSSGISH